MCVSPGGDIYPQAEVYSKVFVFYSLKKKYVNVLLITNKKIWTHIIDLLLKHWFILLSYKEPFPSVNIYCLKLSQQIFPDNVSFSDVQ